MNITFDEKTRIFHLQNADISYAIGIIDEAGYVAHLYFGKRVSDDDLRYLLRVYDYPNLPSINPREGGNFHDCLPFEYPGHGFGDQHTSAVMVRDANGSSAVELLYKDHRIFKGKKKLEGLPATFAGEDEAMTLEIDVEDSVLGLGATLSFTIFEGINAVAKSVKFTNVNRLDSARDGADGESSEAGQVSNNTENDQKVIYLTKALSASLDLPAGEYDLITLHGSWARERQIDRRSICYGDQGVQSMRGVSSHQENPFMAVLDPKADQEHGEVYGFNLVYSGNFQMNVLQDSQGALRITGGINPEDFCWKLDESGSSFQTPEMICVYSANGIGEMSRSFHELYRQHLIRSTYLHKQRPVLINNWEGTYFDFNTDKLLEIADAASECGIEMLVMDDGWFGNRYDDNRALGDWKVNEEKLPGGLKRLSDELAKRGMKFGLWMEPEMICPDSDLYRAHPDYAFQLPGRKPQLIRNQLVLDLTRVEVRDYVWNSVKDTLESANISYMKWDMNRMLTDVASICLPADRQGEIFHRYMLGVYEIMDKVVTNFPDLLLENCSSGGGRFDAGMLYYSPQIWCSDDSDAIERLAIQEGTAICYPLSTMGAHVSASPNHQAGRVTPFATRGAVALAGTFGYELNVAALPEDEKKQIPIQVNAYHEHNDLVREGDYYRLASYHDNLRYDAWEVAAKDGSKALLTYVQVMNKPGLCTPILKPRGLKRESVYCIKAVDMGAGIPDNVSRMLERMGNLHGDTLSNGGIMMPGYGGDFKSLVLSIQEV